MPMMGSPVLSEAIRSWRGDLGSLGARPGLRKTMSHTAAMKHSAQRRPGMIPAANRSPMDCCASTP